MSTTDYEDNDFEDDFDDNLPESEEVTDYMLNPKLSAKFVNL